MLLVLSEEHKEHLSFLPQVDAAGYAEFLRRGASPKVYEGAATLPRVTAVSFSLSLEELNQMLLQLYLQHHSQIRSILSHLPSSMPAYHNLEWRLDVQVYCF
uniref:COMM domain-containing protein n=1 Tax=Maylandia zebra TaxID=106582 RepID=A0A3P9CJG4_9CICH